MPDAVAGIIDGGSITDVYNVVGNVDGVCFQPVFPAPQFRPRMDIGQPPPSTDPVLNRDNSRGYEYQLKLSWTGQAQVRNAILYANPRDVNANVVGQ